MGLVVTARGDKSERLGRLVILGIILYVGLDVVAQVLPPHYSPLHQAESDLAVGPYGLIMQFNFLVRGGLSLALVLALRDLLPAGRSRIGVVLLGVWSGCSALLAFFNTDILDDPALVPHLHLTWHGELHLVLATASFIAAALGALATSFALRESKKGASVRVPAIMLAVLSLLALLAMPRFTVRGLDGLGERIFLLVILCWLGTVALAIRSPRKRSDVSDGVDL